MCIGNIIFLSRSQGSGTTQVCGGDQCTSGMYLTTEGNCNYCPDFHRVDPRDKTKCEERVCSATKYTTADGKCLTIRKTTDFSAKQIRNFPGPVLKMLSVYRGEPVWENYNLDSRETAIIEKYWRTSANLAGGPVFMDLDTEN